MIFSLLAANSTSAETVARKQPDGTYRLYGFKRFTLAAESDVMSALARVADAEGQVKQLCLMVEPGEGAGAFFFFLVSL